jgi:hypothetical protein
VSAGGQDAFQERVELSLLKVGCHDPTALVSESDDRLTGGGVENDLDHAGYVDFQVGLAGCHLERITQAGRERFDCSRSNSGNDTRFLAMNFIH